MPHQKLYFFTPDGLADLKKEHATLLNKRPLFVNELTVARDMGDRSENAAYKGARRKLSATDSRLRFLKRLIDNARVINPDQTEYVQIGSHVTLNHDGSTHAFHIVGDHEVDIAQKKISFKSPIGAALMGKKAGDTAQVVTPAGEVSYVIVKIEV